MRVKILVFMVAVLFILNGLSTVYAENKTILNKIESDVTIEDVSIYEYHKSYNATIGDHQLIDRFKDNLNSAYPIRKSATIIDGEDWDIIVPDDYSTIQEAVDHAYEYNTIMVRSGIYHENVIVDVNALQIIGEDLTTTIIDGDGSEIVLEINAFLVSISGLNITSGEIGLSFGEFSPTFNNIYGNNFYNNQNGIKITGLERSNNIYQNNFIGNNQNAYDPTENNFWYDSNNMIGNYWDDYTGEDSDSDGIGDTPYFIHGNRTADMFPLMDPYCFNCRPSKPYKPTGENKGKIKQTYNYRSSSVDPLGSKLFYWFEWGDGTNTSNWVGPYVSGEECEISHTWFEKGSYDIIVRAKNENGIVSLWSDPLPITMPKNKAINLFLERLMERFPILEQILQPIYVYPG